MMSDTWRTHYRGFYIMALFRHLIGKTKDNYEITVRIDGALLSYSTVTLPRFLNTSELCFSKMFIK